MSGHLAVALLCAALLNSCAAVSSEDLQPGERPALDTIEAGLWMTVDRMEENLRRSGRVVTDPALQDYLRELVCELAPEHCHQVEIYVVEVPYFNASMAPNGMMQVWTGLLLRVDNEAQLAFVLAHELAHFTRRHTLRRWVDLQNKANAATAFGLITAAAGVGYVGYVGQLAAVASIYSFSRDQEREADDLGIARIAAAGLDPGQAAIVWRNLLVEQRASGEDEPSIFMATHPGIEERITRLEQRAETLGETSPLARKSRLDTLIAPHLDNWLGDEVSSGKYAESAVLLARLRESDLPQGLVLFHLADLQRKQGGRSTLEQSVATYRQAIVAEGAPPRLYRNLGQALLRLDRRIEALDALETYVRVVPDADDRALVEAQINDLRERDG